MSIDILSIVRARIGRRHKISAAEMTAILEDLAAAGADIVNGSTIMGRGRDGKLYVGGKWVDDPSDEVRATAQAWARMCTHITCISVVRGSYYVGDELREGPTIRYDDPGSMHPMQQAELIFVPAECEDDECGTVQYMRRHARRVLLVTPIPEQPALPKPVPAWILRLRKHPRMDGKWCRLHDDGVLEMRDPNDNAQARYQYCIDGDGNVLTRRLPPENIGDAWGDIGVPDWEYSRTPPMDELMRQWWEMQGE